MEIYRVGELLLRVDREPWVDPSIIFLGPVRIGWIDITTLSGVYTVEASAKAPDAAGYSVRVSGIDRVGTVQECLAQFIDKLNTFTLDRASAAGVPIPKSPGYFEVNR